MLSSLFGHTVTTPSGQWRGKLLLAAARRAEYLILADDMMKAALFQLVRCGARVVVVLDDTAIVECTLEKGSQDIVSELENTTRSGAETVLKTVPFVCNGQILAAL